MKLVFFSEDTPQGQTVDWPIVPRVGELVQYAHGGGESVLKVEEVTYHANTDGAFHSVTVQLSYD